VARNLQPSNGASIMLGFMFLCRCLQMQKNVWIEPLADVGGKSTATGSFVSMSFNPEEASGQLVSMLKTFIIRPLMLNK